MRSRVFRCETFLFVITPTSAQSQVCSLEVKHAAAHGKRLIPILRENVTSESVNESRFRG